MRNTIGILAVTRTGCRINRFYETFGIVGWLEPCGGTDGAGHARI